MVKSSLVSLFLVTSLVGLGLPNLGFGSTGGGNGFGHYVNQAFDFHVAGPKDWACDNCDAAAVQVRDPAVTARGETSQVWYLHAPTGTTWLRITFTSDFPANSDQELLTAIQTLNPTTTWYSLDPSARGGFIGYTSSSQGVHANAAREYYLVASKQVIMIDWQKDANDADSAAKMDLVIQSIDRASTPPQIKSIHTDKGPSESYNIGDSACLTIEVDDLRAAFEKAGLQTIDIEGALPHFSFKTITWLADQDAYRACFNVTTAFGPNGLRVTNLYIEDQDASRSINCSPDGKDPGLLNCWGSSSAYIVGQPIPNSQTVTIRPVVAAVNNATPDHAGPVVKQLHIDPTNLTLEIDAEDASGVQAAEVSFGQQILIAYPEQLSPPAPIDLSSVTTDGWNTITQMVIYDINGYPTLLRLPNNNAGFRTHQKFDTPAYYQILAWDGTVSMSTIPIVTFLKSGGKNP